MTDQQRADSVGAFGNPAARTPHLDALAARATTFRQAFSQHSACSQSRASMMTGWYPHVAGHRTLDHLLQPWEPNLLKTLRAAGYHVAWAGVRGDTFAPGVTDASTDFHGYLVRPAADALGAAFREAYPPDHPFAHAHYVGRLDAAGPGLDEAGVGTAVKLLADGLPEPWVLYLALFAPHPPFGVEEPWYSLHDRADMPAPVPVPRSGDRKAAFMAALRGVCALDRLDAGQWAEITATYYGMVSRLDDQFGRVVAAVEEAGAAARTVTMFFTDHGEYLGDFGLVEKWPSGLDDCLVRNPLIIAGADIAQGGVCDQLVELIDLLPTVLELAGVDAEHVHFGRSLVPLLADANRPHRAVAFSEGGFRLDEEPQNELRAPHPYAVKTALLHDHPELVGRAVAVRTDRWTYVHRLYDTDELYDRVADPHETTNRAGQPDLSAVERELRDTVLDWLMATSDVIPPARDPRIDPAWFAPATR